MKQIVFLISLLFSLFTFAQVEVKKEKDKILPKANEAFAEKKYAEAEAQYRISNSKGLSGATPSYNLGNSIYRQKQFSESKYAYSQAYEKATTKDEKHKALHNLGNVYMKEKQYGKAVEAYKNALRNNPSDEQTRYNYALAKEYLKNNPEDQNQDKKDDKKDDQKDDQKQDKGDGDKDKKDDKKEGDKDQGKGDNKEDKNEGDQKKDEKQGGQPKPQPSGISKESIQNLLDAVNNEEKKIQEKVNLQKVKVKPVQTEKDW
ncbi:MAG: tetratricopeptide repeat protein [Flavobacterium sp.]|nr:tetratricopeptide repeat protein [Flavobacterium sp.]